MKLLPLLLLVSFAQAAPINKIHLRQLTRADLIALKSAQLIELRFKVEDPAKRVLKWHYESEIDNLHNELSRMITY